MKNFIAFLITIAVFVGLTALVVSAEFDYWDAHYAMAKAEQVKNQNADWSASCCG